jgi:hypothetical protein
MRTLNEPQAQSFYSASVESARRLGTDELAAEIARVVTDLTEARSLTEPDGFTELEDRARGKTRRLVVDVLERKLLALEAIAAERKVQVLLG